MDPPSELKTPGKNVEIVGIFSGASHTESK
jgi:hypothetical protein